jgi:cytochrome b561
VLEIRFGGGAVDPGMSTLTHSVAMVPVAAGRYGAVAMAFHWLVAVAIVAALGVGLYMTGLPFSPERLRLYNWHKWAGITILVLSAARLLWRLAHRPPALPASIERAMPAWQRSAYHGTHLALYVLFFAVPLLGWSYSSAAGFPVVWFGVLPLPDLVPVNKEFADIVLKPLHKASAYLLGAFVVLHVGAALKHQFIDRDGLLSRMWPAGRSLEH